MSNTSVQRTFGWLLTLFGLIVLALGGRGYITGAAVRPGWIVAGLTGIVAGTALVRWAKRTGPE